MQNLSFSISNPANCREYLASMNNKEDERRQHIKKTKKYFLRVYFFVSLLCPSLFRGLIHSWMLGLGKCTLLTISNTGKKKSLKCQQTGTKSFNLYGKKKVFSQDLFLSTLSEVKPCFFDSGSFYRETSSDTRCFLLWIIPFGLKKTLITAIFVTTSDMTSKHIGKWE